MFEYARTYARDMLYNTERMDKICAWLRALAFAYYLAGTSNPRPSTSRRTTWWRSPSWPNIPSRMAGHSPGITSMKEHPQRCQHAENLTGDELAALHEVINKGVTTDQYIQEITARAREPGTIR